MFVSSLCFVFFCFPKVFWLFLGCYWVSQGFLFLGFPIEVNLCSYYFVPGGGWVPSQDFLNILCGSRQGKAIFGSRGCQKPWEKRKNKETKKKNKKQCVQTLWRGWVPSQDSLNIVFFWFLILANF